MATSSIFNSNKRQRTEIPKYLSDNRKMSHSNWKDSRNKFSFQDAIINEDNGLTTVLIDDHSFLGLNDLTTLWEVKRHPKYGFSMGMFTKDDTHRDNILDLITKISDKIMDEFHEDFGDEFPDLVKYDFVDCKIEDSTGKRPPYLKFRINKNSYTDGMDLYFRNVGTDQLNVFPEATIPKFQEIPMVWVVPAWVWVNKDEKKFGITYVAKIMDV